MTIATTLNTKTVVCNGTANPINFPYPVHDVAEIKVYTVSAAGVRSLLTQVTHYIVDIADDFLSCDIIPDAVYAPANLNGVTLYIVRELPLTQPLDIDANARWDAREIEKALDRSAMRDQQLSTALAELVAQAAVDVAALLSGTSSTSVLIGTGSKTFTTQSGKRFSVGAAVIIVSRANSINFMHGRVTAYSGTTLTVNVAAWGGSGTFADWDISVSGVQGAAGMGDVRGPDVGVVDARITVWDGASGDILKDGGKTIAQLDSDIAAKLPASYLDTDVALAANSDTKVASQKAVKTYVDQIIAAQDAMVFKGVTDCSGNPNYPAANRGDTYRVSVAGKIGGAAGVNVEVGDTFICITDGSASGDQATVGANWGVIQVNIDGAVVGPASSTNNNIAVLDGATGKLIKDGGKTIASLDADIAAKAPLASPALTGNPTAPTQVQADDSTKLATTAYVRAAIAAVLNGVSAAYDTLAEIAAWIGTTGTAALKNTGTSGNTVPLLDGNNSYSGQQAFAQATLTDDVNIAWNLNTQQSATVTLAGNRTLDNPTNGIAGSTYILRVKQDATGGRTLAFGTNYLFPGGTDPVLSTAANAIDLLCFYYDGTNMLGTCSKAFA